MKLNTQLIFSISLIVYLKLISGHSDSLSRRLRIRDKVDPIPIFEAFRPNGLKISIPNVDGLQIFGFHANLNKPINLRETGEYHNDIISSENGKWTYYINDIELRIGDVLNYWVYLQMDGIGEQFPKKRYVIPNLIRKSPDLIHRPTPNVKFNKTKCACNDTTNYKTDISTTNNSESISINNCNQTHLKYLENKIDLLENQFESLTEVINDLMKNSNIGRELLLTGINQDNMIALDVVRDIITNQLDLTDLSDKILKAEYISNGILFKMLSSADKKRILIRSLKFLKNSKYKIIDNEAESKTNLSSDILNNAGFNTPTKSTRILPEKYNSNTSSQINGDEKKLNDAELAKTGVSDIFDIDIRIGSIFAMNRSTTESALHS